MVYTKTIIHLSVSESGGYLHHYFPPLREIIVNYFTVSFLMNNLLNKIEIDDNTFKLYEQKVFEAIVFIAIKYYDSVS